MRPVPLLTRRSSVPSIFMRVDLVAGIPAAVDWKISRVPSGEKYASAFSPPKVSWLMLFRCFSLPSRGPADAGGGGACAASAPARETAAAAIASKRTERDEMSMVRIMAQGSELRAQARPWTSISRVLHGGLR